MEQKITAVNERLLKNDNVTDKTHENKGRIQVEQFANNKKFQVDITQTVELLMDGFLRE